MMGEATGRGQKLTRVFDLFLSVPGIVVLSPLFLLIAAAISVESRGPVFFRPERVGRDGVRFRLWKFRSMVANAEAIGPPLTVAGDRRVTRVGRMIRQVKLDELPQLFNVVAGDMSLVGPRPEHARYVALYNQRQQKVLKVRPGLTSLASLAFADESALLTGADWERVYTETLLPQKLALELEYLESRTLVRDLMVVARTTAFLIRTARTRPTP